MKRKFALLNLSILLMSIFAACDNTSVEQKSVPNDSVTKLEERSKEIKDTNKGFDINSVVSNDIINLKNVDGKMVSLKDYEQGKGAIIIFTCNHCPYSKAYEDRINDLNKKYSPKGYPVIAINPNDPALQPEDSFEEMVKRAKDKQFSFPYLIDEGQQVYRTFGALKTPHVYVLKFSDSKWTVEYIGAIDDNHEKPEAVVNQYASDAVESLLANKPIDPQKTVAIGCTIKDKSKQ